MLIIDDNATNREILERRLASWRMRAETATGGQEGLERIRARAAAELYEQDANEIEEQENDFAGMLPQRRGRAGADALQALLPAGRRLGPHAPRRQPALEDLAVGRVVVDDQDVEALELALRRRQRGALAAGRRDLEPERAAVARACSRRRSARPSSPPAGG